MDRVRAALRSACSSNQRRTDIENVFYHPEAEESQALVAGHLTKRLPTSVVSRWAGVAGLFL